MEKLALELIRGIDLICMSYHFHKDENVIEKALVLADKIQQYCGSFLQGNIYGMEAEAYEELKNYVLEVLKDYLEAVSQRDIVYMVDTLDYGLREIADLSIEHAEETEHE